MESYRKDIKPKSNQTTIYWNQEFYKTMQLLLPILSSLKPRSADQFRVEAIISFVNHPRFFFLDSTFFF